MLIAAREAQDFSEGLTWEEFQRIHQFRECLEREGVETEPVIELPLFTWINEPALKKNIHPIIGCDGRWRGFTVQAGPEAG